MGKNGERGKKFGGLLVECLLSAHTQTSKTFSIRDSILVPRVQQIGSFT